MRNKIVLLLVIGMMMALIVGCGSKSEESANDAGESADSGDAESSGIELMTDGKFTFAMSGLYKPFNYKEGGDLLGFDVEIGKALSEVMGFEANPVTTPWETIIQSLKSDKFDAVIGSMAYTDERAEEIDFSKPYYLSGGQVFVAEGNEDIKSVEDLKGKKIGVVPQSTFYDVAEEYSDDLKNYNSDVTALNDLTIKGRLDAVITAPVIGYEAMNAGLEVKPAGDLLWIEEACVAVKKGNPELVEAINEAIDTIVENGTYDEISNNLFGRSLLDMETEGVPIMK